jgi:RNA recognition motif-containing protein
MEEANNHDLAASGKRLFVGNISYNSTNDNLESAFAQFGKVVSAEIKYDRDNRSKGFAFVEMSTPEEAQAAIEGLNGKELDGRPLTVNLARPMKPHNHRDSGNWAR